MGCELVVDLVLVLPVSLLDPVGGKEGRHCIAGAEGRERSSGESEGRVDVLTEGRVQRRRGVSRSQD